LAKLSVQIFGSLVGGVSEGELGADFLFFLLPSLFLEQQSAK
jgi:hypothetical protein